MFSTAELERQLNQGTVKIPDGHSKAIVIHGDTESKAVTVTLVSKLGKGWQVDTSFGWQQDKGVDAGFNVSWSK